MKQRLTQLAAAVLAAGVAGGAGVVVFVNWESGDVERVVVDIDGWQMLDRDSCSARACGANQCDVARNHLADAGLSQCDPRFAACDWRVSSKMRTCLERNGVTLGPKKYHRVELLALRCPVAGGGFSWGVPVDDAGCPIWASSSAEVTPRCVRAPVAGGTGCQRSVGDGGFRYFGAGNVFPAALSNSHASCEPVNCTVLYGDDPAVDL